MPRPTKCRRVSFIPEIVCFKPAGVPMSALDSVALSIDELEAIRLKDHEGLEQEEAAVVMGISRPTFRRVLWAARRKLADALINGKAIRIEGGILKLGPGRFRCGWDGHEWEVPDGEAGTESVRVCPRCRRSNVGAGHGGGHRWRCGRGWVGEDRSPVESRNPLEEQSNEEV